MTQFPTGTVRAGSDRQSAGSVALSPSEKISGPLFVIPAEVADGKRIPLNPGGAAS